MNLSVYENVVNYIARKVALSSNGVQMPVRRNRKDVEYESDDEGDKRDDKNEDWG